MQKLPNSFFVVLVIIVGMLGLFPACRSRYQSCSPSVLPLFTDEAKLIDVPLPLRVVPYTLESFDSAHTMLMFTSLLAREDLISFYELEMERLGWQQSGLFLSVSEGLLIFEKPRKLCIISLRPESQVILSVGAKKIRGR